MSDKEVWKLQRKIMKEINALTELPCINIEAKEHATMVRKALKKKFPDIKFSVTSDQFAGGDAVHVKLASQESIKAVKFGSDIYKKIDKFIDLFDGYRGDLMDGRYNVGFEYDGKRYCGASFCRFNM
jgi:hypothetical protein